jgi:hypothetical protein
VVRALSLGADPVPVALAGGLLLEAEFMRTMLVGELKNRTDHFSSFNLVHEPVSGAVKAALALANG